MELDRHVQIFRNFASGHLTGESDHDYHINLKIDHSMRVLDNARTIIEREGIQARPARLATLAALYHDIGRFPQLARYGTYKDRDSINHGRLGVLTLRGMDLPGQIPETDWRIVRAAIGLHNAKNLNPATPDLLKTVTGVVRDADKLDIYYVILAHLDEEANSTGAVIHNLEEAPDKYTPAVLDEAYNEITGDYASLRYSNDFILLLIGWLFKLSFPTSVQLLAERKLIEKAFSLLPNDEAIGRLKTKCFNFMHYNER